MTSVPRILQTMLRMAIFLVISTSTILSQFVWPRADDRSSVTLRVLSASYNGISGVTGYSTSFSCRIKGGEKAFLVADIPYMVSKETPTLGPTTSKCAVGNAYVGFEWTRDDPSISGEFGVRLPTMAEKDFRATDATRLGDIDRLEAYFPRFWTLQGAFNYHPVGEEGFGALMRLGASLWVPTKAAYTTQIFIDYGLGLGFDGGIARIGVGFSGRFLTTSRHELFTTENPLHRFEVGADARVGPIRPGIFYRVPLPGSIDWVCSSFGATISVDPGMF